MLKDFLKNIITLASDFKVEQIKIKPSQDSIVNFAMKSPSGTIIYGQSKTPYPELKYGLGITNISLLNKIFSNDMITENITLKEDTNPVTNNIEYTELCFSQKSSKLNYRLSSLEVLDKIILVKNDGYDIEIDNIDDENLMNILKKLDLASAIDEDITFITNNNELIAASGAKSKNNSEISICDNISRINNNLSLKDISWKVADIKVAMAFGRSKFQNVNLKISNKGAFYVIKENDEIVVNVKNIGNRK